MNFTMTGGKELAAALASLPPRVSKKFLIEALKESAEPMAEQMERNVAVGDTPPHVRDEIGIGLSRGEDSREAAIAVGATKAGFYGSFLERGTAHHAPRPWAGPAFDATWMQSLRILSAALWREMASRGVQRPSETVSTPLQGEV